jgi:hypothetical protein
MCALNAASSLARFRNRQTPRSLSLCHEFLDLGSRDLARGHLEDQRDHAVLDPFIDEPQRTANDSKTRVIGETTEHLPKTFYLIF